MRYKLLGVAGALAIAAAVLGLTLPAAAGETSKVFVVHGIPGQPVDGYVNGAKKLPDFQPATVAGPLDLPAGSYDIVLTEPGADPAADPLLAVDGVVVPGGRSLSLVAHLTVDGAPTLTAFVNDTSRVAAGKARLVVRHTAAAPAVDVRAGGAAVFLGLTNPDQAGADVAAGTVGVDVLLAGTGNVVLGPVDVNPAEGTATMAYVIGSARDRTLAIATQVTTGLHTAPGGVPAGSGGLAAPAVPVRWYALAVLGVLLLLTGVAGATRPVGAVHRR